MLKLFSTSVYTEKLDLNVDKIIKYCLSLKKQQKGLQVSNQGGWHSNILGENIPELNPLFNKVLKAANNYKEIISYKHPLKISASWVMINGYKDYNVEHMHPNSVLSGAYYLTTDNSNIVFINPSSEAMGYTFSHNDIEKYNEFNSNVYRVKPSANDLLIFPSWLKHRVGPNLTKKNRICISFNIKRKS